MVSQLCNKASNIFNHLWKQRFESKLFGNTAKLQISNKFRTTYYMYFCLFRLLLIFINYNNELKNLLYHITITLFLM